MKTKLSARIISIFLAVMMVVTILPSGMLTASAASNDYLYWAQTDSRWKNISIAADNHASCTMGSYGCWITSYDKLLIQSGKVDQNFTPASMTQWLKNNSLLNNDGTLKGSHQQSIANAFGLKFLGTKYASSFDSYNDLIKSYVDQGCYVLIRWGTGRGRHTSIVDNYLTRINGYTTTSNSWGLSNYNVKMDSSSYINMYGRNIAFIDVFQGDGTAVVPPTPKPPTNDTHYDAAVSKSIGTYKNICNSGINMRSSAGVNAGNKIGCTVPENAEVYVYETNGNWGKITFAGKVGWVCLDYFEKISIPVPAAPTLNAINSGDIAKGKSITLTWNPVNGAERYTVAIHSDSYNNEINAGGSTSYTFSLANAEKYSFSVKAANVSGDSNWSNTQYCTAHNPVTVNFVDWDDTPLGSQTVNYGDSANAPDSPHRKGYTFKEWDGSYRNLTSNITIKATYKINVYTVNFFDRKGDLINSQKVNFGDDAVPPTNTNAEANYEFIGWNSTDYIDVYTDRADKNINIDGIYSWYNYDLPAVCTVTEAIRNFDGYSVTLNIENNDSRPTTGRVVVALKTSEGKLVDMTESTAFSIPTGKTKNGIEVFVPCKKTAAKAEVYMVDNYSSGIPISPSVTTDIQKGLMYTESNVKPDNIDGTLDIQEVTQYSYRDKEFSTGNTKTKAGWEYVGTRSEQVGGWSGWGWNWIGSYDTESQRREVQTQSAVQSYNYKNVYHYYHCHLSNGNVTPTWNANTAHYLNLDWELAWQGTSSVGNTPYYGYYSDGGCKNIWYRLNDFVTQEVVSANYGTQYRYRDINYLYNFYRWKNWTEWNDTPVTANANRDVRTQLIYRYQSNEPQIEDTTGEIRTVSGKLDKSFAGKQITLYVYGYTGASDYTNEFMGQSVVGEDGSYSFTFKLREEPSIKTGDFTVAIGIEGTTNTTVIDTIEAPKPTYTVNFYDWEGNIISTQTVKKGENAVLPKNPEKEGYNFIGWDKSNVNITEDTDIFADFAKKEFTVVFVDWSNQLLEIRKFEYGDVLTTPEYKNMEGYNFVGWDEIIDGNIIVTQDMVVSAVYEAKEYSIKFYDWNNNVIDEQLVKYGETALVPDDPSGEDVNFAGWFNPEDYQYVEKNAEIYPSYYFEETTALPVADYESGEYDDKIELSLNSADENAVIFYYINGDETTEQIYTKPITIDKTCSVTYYASSFGKNDSEIQTNYYCINSSDKPSEWLLYSELPQEVKDNLDDYVLESETGYRYKDVKQSSSSAEIADLESNGWTYVKTEYTPYTAWQDDKIEVNNNLIGFEVDTQEVADPTVTWYKYSHYKYTDGGTVKYSPVEVAGFNCEYEEIVVENRLSIAGFTDDEISFYEYNGQQWFTQERVSGIKTQYRSRYQVAEYFKWTPWNIEAPAPSENREYETDDIYRYANKNYHIVEIIDRYSDVPTRMLVVDSDKIDVSIFDIYGYDFAGLYYDGEFVNEFDLSSPITESATLFTKYLPKKYTVIFQMKDGTELDVQQVEYLCSATEPETDSVPGYVFGGWDKEFDCITEDTVITGKYFKESEYARISLDSESVYLYSGTTAQLNAKITPENLTNEVVEWSSSDNSVAMVDNNGKITAVSQGVATITATVVKTKETAICTVYVTQDLSTGILLKNESSLNYDELGYLRRVNLGTTVEEVSAEFVNTNLRFFNSSGTELELGDNVGTGTEIRLYKNGEIVDKKTAVVTGDMNGDGVINNRDVLTMNRAILLSSELKEYQALALDVNGDGYVNNRDLAMVARYIVGKQDF